MICPQTEKNCRAFECLRLKGCRLTAKPSVAEIERLVDAFESAIDHVHYFESVEHVNNQVAARAALMAAIRKLAEKKDA